MHLGFVYGYLHIWEPRHVDKVDRIPEAIDPYNYHALHVKEKVKLYIIKHVKLLQIPAVIIRTCCEISLFK